MPARKLCLMAVIGTIWLGMFMLNASPAAAAGATPGPEPTEKTPTPPPPVPPTATPSPPQTIIQKIFHQLTFPASTISESLTSVVGQAVEQETSALDGQIRQWTARIGQAARPPAAGEFEGVARTSLPGAAALAPALFLLRLALYHWRRLSGEEDTPQSVIADWLTAGALALAAGPILDIAARLGWALSGLVLGGSVDQLASQFVQAMTSSTPVNAIEAGLFGSLLRLGLAIGGVLAVAGMMFAFAAAQAALYLMAVLSAPLAVLGVLPQTRWMRSLWVKALGILALLPFAGGGVFAAAVYASNYASGEGLISDLIHILWLWGAVGFLLSLAGILGKVTLSTSVDALQQMVGAAKAVAGIAAAAVTGGATIAGAVGGAAGATGVGGLASTSAGAGAVTSEGASALETAAAAGGSLPGVESNLAALDHLEAAGQSRRWGTALDAAGRMFGVGGLGAPLYAQAQQHENLARRAQLEARLAEMTNGGEDGGRHRNEPSSDGAPVDGDPGVQSAPADQAAQSISQATGIAHWRTVGDMYAAYSLNSQSIPNDLQGPQGFASAFNRLNTLLTGCEPAHDLRVIGVGHGEEVGRMVGAYAASTDFYDQSPTPFLHVAQDAQASFFLRNLELLNNQED